MQVDGKVVPKVSIIMSVYNCESTVEEALRSIFNQTYTNWELIICDDASTDRTLSVVKRILSELDESKYTLLTNPSNLKLAASLNRCLDLATGDFIARMDGDDLSVETRFERQVEILLEHPEIDMVGTSMQRFNTHGLGGYVHPAAEFPDRWTLSKTTKAPFAHATIMARRMVFSAVGNYTVHWTTQRAQDLDLWYKFFEANLTGYNLPEAMYLVREDEAAVRRRTPKTRFITFLLRIKGNRALGYPLSAYFLALSDIVKIFVPYQVVDLQRKYSQRRAARKMVE